MTEIDQTNPGAMQSIPEPGEAGGWGAKFLRLCGFYSLVSQEFSRQKSNLQSSQIKTVIIQTISSGGFVLPETPKQKYKREQSALRYHYRFGKRRILGEGVLRSFNGFEFIHHRG